MTKYVAVVPYGNAGTQPLNNNSCPLYEGSHTIVCVSSSGDSICSGFTGFASDDVVECQETSSGGIEMELDMTELTQESLNSVLKKHEASALRAEGFYVGELEAHVNTDIRIHEVREAARWLAKNRRRATINRKYSSYQLKHFAEKTAEGGYISNGALIAAAYHLGFDVEPAGGHSPNAYLNISSKTVTPLRAAVGYD